MTIKEQGVQVGNPGLAPGPKEQKRELLWHNMWLLWETLLGQPSWHREILWSYGCSWKCELNSHHLFGGDYLKIIQEALYYLLLKDHWHLCENLSIESINIVMSQLLFCEAVVFYKNHNKSNQTKIWPAKGLSSAEQLSPTVLRS